MKPRGLPSWTPSTLALAFVLGLLSWVPIVLALLVAFGVLR